MESIESQLHNILMIAEMYLDNAQDCQKGFNTEALCFHIRALGHQLVSIKKEQITLNLKEVL